jgi:uncharacterized membrane protein
LSGLIPQGTGKVVTEPTFNQNGGKMKTRDVVQSAIIAALYVVFTVLLAPFSFGPIQFRISEIFKVFVLFNPYLAVGIGMGTFFANLFSPNVGPWELIWMPFTDMAGGLLAWALFRYIFRSHTRFAVVPMAVYALCTGAAVGLMLSLLGFGGFWLMTLSVGASEAIILVAGAPLMLWIVKTLKDRGIDLNPGAQTYP